MIKSTLYYALETTINALLRRSTTSQPLLEKLDNAVIQLTITDWQLNLFWIFNADKIRLVSEWDHPVTSSISGELIAITRLGLSGAKVAKDLTVSGDLHQVELFKRLFAELHIDWQAELTPFIGAGKTHTIEIELKKIASGLRNIARSLRESSKDYMQEESRILPTRFEFDEFSQSVRQLQRRIEKISHPQSNHKH